MKRILFSFLLLWGIVMLAQGRSKSPRKLYYAYSSTPDFVFRHLVQTDTATLLYVKVNMPHWWKWSINGKLHLVANGQKLPYRGGVFLVKKGKQVEEQPFMVNEKNSLIREKVGDEMVYSHDSLLLRFDPLPKGVKTFDFFESDDPADRPWTVLGIKWDGKSYPSSLPPVASQLPSPDLSAYTPRYAKAVLRGHIRNYRKEMGGFSYFANRNYGLKGESFPFKVQSDSLGNFSYEMETSYPVLLSPNICGGQWRNLLLVPGEELVIDVDMAALSERGALSTDLVGWRKQPPAVQFQGNYAALNEVVWGMDFPWKTGPFDKPFPQFANELWDSYQDELLKIDANPSLQNVQKEYARLLAQKSYLGNRIYYAERLGRALRWVGQKSDSLLYKEREAEFTLVDPHAQELDFFDNLKALFVCPDTIVASYMEANGLTGSPVYKWLMDLKAAQTLSTRINLMQPVTDESVWKTVAPQYVESLKQLNDTMLLQLEMMKQSHLEGRICEAPSVAPEQLISEIVARYKGKAVFIDCWATWCGPCKNGIEKMEPLKKELEGKDVVFVYMTDESSEFADWSKHLEKIPGEHYRIPISVWRKLPGIQAIPHYFIYDREGNKVFDHTGWNNRLLSEFKNVLLKALGE